MVPVAKRSPVVYGRFCFGKGFVGGEHPPGSTSPQAVHIYPFCMAHFPVCYLLQQFGKFWRAGKGSTPGPQIAAPILIRQPAANDCR